MAKQLLSSKEELLKVSVLLQNYLRLPFSNENVPGAVLEGILAHVRGAKVLRTYDFVDVVDRESKLGWQVKSTLAETPLTWKRAKIENREKLIAASEASSDGLVALGKEIIDFCNKHAQESIDLYDLDQIGYARLIVHSDGLATYFERILCTRAKPLIFNPKSFSWNWSKERVKGKKEQLTALHATHTKSKKKWFAWHGRGENQLHFSGEESWWPTAKDKSNSITFALPKPSERLSIEEFVNLLADGKAKLPKVD